MSTQTITEDPRQEKGRTLAASVARRGSIWIVPSSKEGEWHVRSEKGVFVCECPDYELRHQKCKHVWAVEFFLHVGGGASS